MIAIDEFSIIKIASTTISITTTTLSGDVSGTIDGKSGDLTYVGRVTRVWVETKWG